MEEAVNVLQHIDCVVAAAYTVAGGVQFDHTTANIYNVFHRFLSKIGLLVSSLFSLMLSTIFTFTFTVEGPV